jgi:hypothetical protein
MFIDVALSSELLRESFDQRRNCLRAANDVFFVHRANPFDSGEG